MNVTMNCPFPFLPLHTPLPRAKANRLHHAWPWAGGVRCPQPCPPRSPPALRPLTPLTRAGVRPRQPLPAPYRCGVMGRRRSGPASARLGSAPVQSQSQSAGVAPAHRSQARRAPRSTLAVPPCRCRREARSHRSAPPRSSRFNPEECVPANRRSDSAW